MGRIRNLMAGLVFVMAAPLVACGGTEGADASAIETDTTEQGLSCYPDPQFIADYCHGQNGAPYSGQCLGQNVLIPNFCVILDPSHWSYGCAVHCNGA